MVQIKLLRFQQHEERKIFQLVTEVILVNILIVADKAHPWDV